MRRLDFACVAAVVLVAATLVGCADLDRLSRQTIGSNATVTLKQSFHSVVYKGQAWNMPYEVLRQPDGEYLIRQLPGEKTRKLGRFRSLSKVYATRTDDFGVEAFLAPTPSCAHHYLLVVAHGNARGHFTSIGCRTPLTFQAGSDNHVYATQSAGSGIEPLAYRIGATGISGPKPVGRLAGYPQTLPPPPGLAHAPDGTTSGYRGRVWNFPYVITSMSDGRFSIRKLTGSKSSNLGRLLSLRKVYSTQTDTFGVDAFATPTQECPHQYLLVIGSGNGRGKYKSLGCALRLNFQRGPDGRVYAAQVGVGDAVPLAYVIGAARLSGPKPITQLAGYPQRDPHGAVVRENDSNARENQAEQGALRRVPEPAPAPQWPQPSEHSAPAAPTPVTIDLGGQAR